MAFIATNGGVHPPDKLAEQAANQIGEFIRIADTASSELATKARRQKPHLVLDIKDALEDHHDAVMQFEREQLAQGTAHLSTSLDPRDHEAHATALQDAVAAVVACAKGTVFEKAFASPQAGEVIAGIVGIWFATAIDIERDWVARGHTVDRDGKAQPNPDHDPTCPHVLAWRGRRAA